MSRFFVFLLILLLAACNFNIPQPTPTVAPTRTPTRPPDSTATPSRTPPPTIAPTRIVQLPTETSTITETPTTESTEAPSATPTFDTTPRPSKTPSPPPTLPTSTPQESFEDITPPPITLNPPTVVAIAPTSPPFVVTPAVPQVVATNAVVIARNPAPAPPSGAFVLSANGSVVTVGDFNFGGFPTQLVAQNPAAPNQFAAVNSAGQIYLIFDYAGGRFDQMDRMMTNFTIFHYQISNRADNDKPVTQIEWSNDGTLAVLIDGDKNLDDGVWMWSPDRGTNVQLLRECWMPAICENIMNKQGMTGWEARHLSWAPDSSAVLITINITAEGRDVFVIADRYRPDPGNVPPLNRYDYGTWSLDSQTIIVSGRDPNGVPVMGRITRDGRPLVIAAASRLGYSWIQNAAEYGGKIYGFASRDGAGGALQLIDENGVALTPPFVYSPERVSWSPDHSAVLVVEGGTRKHWLVFLPSGSMRDITAQVASGMTVDWVSVPLPF